MSSHGVTGFIVGLNEEPLLRQALPHLQDLDELIYVDLGSSDDSINTAKQLSASVICHEKVPVVEIIHSKLLPLCKNDWILITDPDEVVDSALKEELKLLAAKNPYDVAMITAPIQFYFKSYPLKGTLWGGNNSRVVLVNKNRVDFSSHVHRGRKMKAGFKQHFIENKGNNIIHHYWMASYKQLIEKHRRYIEREGESMFLNGHRTSIIELIKAPINGFRECFFSKKGYLDGFVGFNLSIFWAWYKTRAYLSLRGYEKAQIKHIS